jgi:hypothetical protein
MTTPIFVILKHSIGDDAELVCGVTDSEEAAANYVNTFNNPDYHARDWDAWFERFTLNNLPALKPDYAEDRLKKELLEKMQSLKDRITTLAYLSHASPGAIAAVSAEIEACLAKIEELEKCHE